MELGDIKSVNDGLVVGGENQKINWIISHFR
jgi:hypothetical protein